MPSYNYQARTKAGELREGTVEAPTREAAVNLLQRHDLIITSVKPAVSVPIFAKRLEFLERVRQKDVVIFSRQLSSLMEAKIPLVECLKTLSKQTSSRLLKEKILEISEDVEGGSNLSGALAKHPKVFSKFYVNMVKAGEASGNLEKSLSYLADYLEKEYDLVKEIKGALSYPAFILIVFIIAGIVIMTVVIPQLVDVLEEAGQELPLTTKILIGGSNFLIGFWWLLAAIFGAAVFLFFHFKKSKEGSEFLDRMKLKLPVFGKLLKLTYLARFADNLSVLIKGGLPITKSLKITADVIGNSVYKKILYEVAEKVKAGGSIADTLTQSPRYRLW